MKPQQSIFLLGILSLAAFAWLFHPIGPVMAAPKEEKEIRLPDGAKGFAGILHGKFVSKDDTGTTFVLKVDKVEKAEKYRAWNKSKKPESMKGQKVLIHVRWVPGKVKNKYEPDSAHVRFVKTLESNAKVSVDVYSDAWNRMILVDVPKGTAPSR